MFQSTHPHGVRLSWCVGLKLRESFNPRTHMGCDIFFLQNLMSGVCFNPRTHMGCDTKRSCYHHRFKRFNPRTHMGCDGWQGTFSCGIEVSIHAPTWGATVTMLTGQRESNCFNPRTHMGCDSP